MNTCPPIRPPQNETVTPIRPPSKWSQSSRSWPPKHEFFRVPPHQTSSKWISPPIRAPKMNQSVAMRPSATNWLISPVPFRGSMPTEVTFQWYNRKSSIRPPKRSQSYPFRPPKMNLVLPSILPNIFIMSSGSDLHWKHTIWGMSVGHQTSQNGVTLLGGGLWRPES